MNAPKQKAKVLSTYQLMKLFPDEPAAIEFLKKILWPNGPVCPYCGSERHCVRADQSYACKDCRKSYTIRSETIFHRSHIKLHVWLYAMYLVVTARKSISSLQLSKELGIKQTHCWHMMHRIRAACSNQEQKLLSGIVESDEVHIGGIEKNRHESKKRHLGRGPIGKVHVQGLRERDGGRVIAQVVPDTTKETLQGMIRENVATGSTVCSDESSSYVGLDKDYTHKTVNHSAKQFVNEMASTNSIESVWALLKREYVGTFHNFSEKHTQLYVDEVSFRLNEANCEIDTIDRLVALVKGVIGKRLSYKMLVHGV